MSIESRIKKIEGFIGGGEAFQEGVTPGDAGLWIQYGFLSADENSPYPAGFHQVTGEPAPEGHWKTALMMAISSAAIVVFSGDFDDQPKYAEYIAEDKAFLGLDGTEDEETAMARCLELGTEANFNKAEMVELKRVLAGTCTRPKRPAFPVHAGVQQS